MAKIRNKVTGEVKEVSDKELTKYGLGGNVDMAKNGKKIKMKLKKAEIGVYNQEDPTFNVGDQGYNEQVQYNPVTGEKFKQKNEFNPSLTFGLQNYYQSKGKNAPAYLSSEEGSQYADYVNTQPKQQNVNNNTFANNVAPYLPTQGMFNDYYSNQSGNYRKQAMENFSNGNYAAGAVNAFNADLKDVKGGFNRFSTIKTKLGIAQIEAQNKRQNLISQFENPTPTFQNGWGGNNPLDNGYIPVGEYGMSIKEIGGQGQPNIEVEGSEHIQLPNGFSQEIQGNSHAEGGIPLNLPQDSKVFSEKLKHPEMKKSYAKMAKKFETKKDFKQLENPISSKLNKSTAELNIKLKNQGLDELFMEQEMNKIEGFHGKIPQKETLQDYQMKNGGSVLPETAAIGKLTGKKARIKAFQEAMLNQENNTNGTDAQYYGQNNFDPTAPIENLNTQTAQLTSLNPNTIANQPIGYNLTGWKTDKYPSKAFPKLGGNATTRYTDEDINRIAGQLGFNPSKFEGKDNNEKFQRFLYSNPEWAKIIDGLHSKYGKPNVGNPKDNKFDSKIGVRWQDALDQILATQPKAQTPTIATQQPAVKQNSIPGTIPSLQAEKLNRLKGFNPNITALQLPDAYVKDPITVNNLQPEFYQPNTITPYLNDIQRLQYATNTNLGTSGADLASRANSFGQGLTEYGKRYYDASTYNAGVKTQAAKDNALTKLNTNQFNNSNYINNARNPQLQRSAVISEQQRLDREAQLKTFADKEHEQNVNNYLQTIYDPNYALNANFSNPYELKSASVESEEAKKAKAYETLYGKKKYGGKLKLKPKRKK